MVFHSDITGIGYCSIDYLCMVPRIPHDDKVEIIQGMTQGGGPAATAIVAAARLGAKTAFAGAVGDDERGKAIMNSLSEEGIYLGGMKIRNGSESPAAFCWIEQSGGKRSIAWTKGNVKALSPDEIDMDLIRNSKALHLDGHQTEAAIAAARAAKENGVTVSIDAGTFVPGIDELLELSDIIIASEKFALRYTLETDMDKAAKKLFKGKCLFSAVTMGINGSVGFDGKNVLKCSSFKVDVIDTTGAGDVFHGAFIYKYVNGGNWDECLRFASAVSALKCTRLGGRTGIPTLKKAVEFLNWGTVK